LITESQIQSDRHDTQSNEVRVKLQEAHPTVLDWTLRNLCLVPCGVRNISSSAFVADYSFHQRNKVVSQDTIFFFKAFHTSSMW